MSTAEQSELEMVIRPPRGGIAALQDGWALFPIELVTMKINPGAIVRYLVIEAANAEGRLVPKRGESHDQELQQLGFIEVTGDGIVTTDKIPTAR